MKCKILSYLVPFVFLLSGTLQAACGVHDQTCRFHSIGSQQSHIGKNLAHHTKGIQQTPAIPNTPDGLYFFGAWQDNSSGSKADLDLDVLLPDAILDQQNNTIASGPFVVSNNANLGGAPANTNPFGHIPNQADRHVDTFQYQITFASNTATAIHSQDANGLAPVAHPVQTNETCDTSSTGLDSCEHVHIKGNIPSGIYGGALTNYDIHNLADPSTPLYAVWAVVQGNINGDLIYLDNIPVLTGSIQNRAEISPIFSVGFVNRNFNSHAEGVVLDNYQTSHSSNLKYGDIYKRMQGNYLSTYQDTFRDHWKTNRRETINAQGIVSNKENLGTAKGSFQKRVHAGTNTISTQYIAPPPPPKPRAIIKEERVVFGPQQNVVYEPDQYNSQMFDANSIPISTSYTQKMKRLEKGGVEHYLEIAKGTGKAILKDVANQFNDTLYVQNMKDSSVMFQPELTESLINETTSRYEYTKESINSNNNLNRTNPSQGTGEKFALPVIVGTSIILSKKPTTGILKTQDYPYAPRIRERAVQDPKSHNFPYTFDKEILKTTPIPKKNGYNIYQKEGSMTGKDGLFEIGVTKDGIIDHRFFRPNK